MASLVSRLVACLVAVVAILQLVHLVLLNKLETRRLSELQQLKEQQPAASLLPNRHHPPQGKDHSHHHHLDSIINSPARLISAGQVVDDTEIEKLAARLLAEHEGTIVDATGEFRIVFDIAGSRPSSGDNGNNGGAVPYSRSLQQQQENQPPPPPLQHQLQLEHLNDDFSIDDEASDSIDVTLVTQGDLTNAKAFLPQLVERWQGPISLALYARNSSQVDSSLEFIAQIRRCQELSRQYVSFHLVFPLVESSNGGSGGSRSRRKKGSLPLRKRKSIDPKECQKFRDDILQSKGELESNLNYDDRVYPVNLLRNVARKRVMTEFSFVTDIDMLPSGGLRAKFQKFARDKQLDKAEGDEKKSVFVVPAFESKNGEAPWTKKQLLNLIDTYQVRPFYFDLCWKCQVHTDYETWQREPESRSGDLSVLFEVLWKDPWEPFFIADNSVPNFDERFRQYGFNRLSQLCELHVAGYKFAVLNDAFLIHQGYKTVGSFHPGRTRDVENNRLNFRQFKIELKDKYPLSTRRCY